MLCRVKLSTKAGGLRGATPVISSSSGCSSHFNRAADACIAQAWATIPGRTRYEVSTRPTVRTFTAFPSWQGVPAFPPDTRVLLAHTHWPQVANPWTETSGLLLLTQGLPACLVLAPCMQLSLHTAPTSRFPELAIPSVGAGGPWRITRRTKRVAVWLGWRPPIRPPNTDRGPSGPSTGSVCRNSFACLTTLLPLH